MKFLNLSRELFNPNWNLAYRSHIFAPKLFRDHRSSLIIFFTARSFSRKVVQIFLGTENFLTTLHNEDEIKF